MRSRIPALLAAAVVLGLASLTQGATFTVTTDADSGSGSLREAITLAEANGEADLIDFGGDLTITLLSTLPVITTDITIQGNGWDRTIIEGGNASGTAAGVRAFEIVSTGSLALVDVMVRNCYSDSDGGAVYNLGGTLAVVSSSMKNNSSTSYGGAIASWAGSSLQVESSWFEGNSCNLWGSDIAAWQVTVPLDARVTDSSFVDAGGGPALFFQGVDDVAIEGSTVSGASTSAVFLFYSSGSIVNSTLSGNSIGIDFDSYSSTESLLLRGVTIASSTGIGLNMEGSDPHVSLDHTIISGSGTADCVVQTGTLTTLGHNLDSDMSCGLDQAAGDLMGFNPLLGPLQDNGGLTFTREPLPGSPVIDAGAADCGLARDQRGALRPLDGDNNGTALCDIGAVEVGLIFADGFESGDTSEWSLVY